MAAEELDGGDGGGDGGGNPPDAEGVVVGGGGDEGVLAALADRESAHRQRVLRPRAQRRRRRPPLLRRLQQRREGPDEDDGVGAGGDEEAVVRARRHRRARLEVRVPREEQPAARELPQVELARRAARRQVRAVGGARDAPELLGHLHPVRRLLLRAAPRVDERAAALRRENKLRMAAQPVLPADRLAVLERAQQHAARAVAHRRRALGGGADEEEVWLLHICGDDRSS